MGIQTKESIEENLDEIFKLFYITVDYDELELGRFLSIKDSKNFNLLLITKYICFVFILSTIIFTVPIFWFVVAIYGYVDVGYLSLITIIPIVLYFLSDTVIIRRFNYNFALYRKEKHDLLNFLNQFLVILSNHEVKSELIEKTKYNDYEKNFKEIQTRIHRFSNIFKPYMYYFEQFGLISIISIFVSFFIGFLISNISTSLSDELRLILVIRTLSYICTILAMLLLFSIFGDYSKLFLYSEREILLIYKKELDTKITTCINLIRDYQFKGQGFEDVKIRLKDVHTVSKVALILKLIIVMLLILIHRFLFHLTLGLIG